MFLLFFSFIQAAFAYQIMIDPGHGGTDTGAVRGENVESHIALAVANRLTQKLKATQNIEVTETRSLDETVLLKDRVLDADRINPDIFISIHVNSSDDPKAKGVEFYFNPSELVIPDSSKTEAKLAENIMRDFSYSRKLFQSKHLAKTLAGNWQNLSPSPTRNRRKILQAPFYVVSKTKVPSILIELGFLSHPQEANLLRSSDHQEKLAEELYQGLLSYIKEQSSYNLNPRAQNKISSP
jgi:N-acetylmuramoyl-L-alanine amidase